MQSFRCPLALVILFIFSVSAFAQIEFEEAYYITQDGVKKQGLIKNLGWKKIQALFSINHRKMMSQK